MTPTDEIIVRQLLLDIAASVVRIERDGLPNSLKHVQVIYESAKAAVDVIDGNRVMVPLNNL